MVLCGDQPNLSLGKLQQLLGPKQSCWQLFRMLAARRWVHLILGTLRWKKNSCGPLPFPTCKPTQRSHCPSLHAPPDGIWPLPAGLQARIAAPQQRAVPQVPAAHSALQHARQRGGRRAAPHLDPQCSQPRLQKKEKNLYYRKLGSE